MESVLRDWVKKYQKEKKLYRCVGIDLDGVLAKYHEGWLSFLSQRSGYKVDNLWEAKKIVPPDLYARIKDQYRSSEAKLHLEPHEGARELLWRISKKALIFIITARPFDLYPTLLNKTILWLKKNSIVYDHIVQRSQKYIYICHTLPQMSFFIDDDRRIVSEIASMGIPCFLYDNLYNQGPLPSNVTRIKSLLAPELLATIEKW